MKKIMFKATLMNPSTISDCFIGEDCIIDFLYQHRDCSSILLKGEMNEFYLKAEYGKVIDCIDKEVEERISTSLKNIEAADKEQKWSPLEVFKIDFEVFSLESVYIYSPNRKQVEQDFALWSIFDPMEIYQVA
ncbi:hypothetical protein [Robertmurraya sp. FSL R5-0851]|uniref:hypothetical protein n=1 Tax=Robertmurraya sp. FSL R5-0851 TaxID=2921584 RepID=UPI0030FA8D0E